MSARGWKDRMREALACEECRRWRNAMLLALLLVALIWLTSGG